MKKNLWLIVAFVFLSFAQLGAMDPPKIILPEWYSCDGKKIYTFDGDTFYERKTGNIFIVNVGQEKLTLFGVKPAYYESDNGDLYSYNGGVTFYNFEGKKCDNAGQEVVIPRSSPEKSKNNSWQASKTPSPGQNRARLNLRLKERSINQ